MVQDTARVQIVQLMTNRKSYRRIQWYHFAPSRVTPNKGTGPQFGNRETVYISEVSGARKVKTRAQVTMNKNSNPV